MHEPAIFARDRVTIVGVLNLTPDSFSDGGRFLRGGTVDRGGALAAAQAMVAAGAHVVDVGGESTRPGAAPVPEAQQIDRTAPLIRELAKSCPVPVSIDTRSAAVAQAALDAGARVVNDVSGLRHDPAIAAVAARAGAWLVVGHLRDEPARMQQAVHFDDVVGEVAAELADSVARARAAGVGGARIVVDPGIGFGKHPEHSLALLAQLGRLRAALDLPLLVGPSRKSFLGAVTGDPVSERDTASHAACAVAIFAGADAIRVHDVAGARRAAAVALALRNANTESSGGRP